MIRPVRIFHKLIFIYDNNVYLEKHDVIVVFFFLLTFAQNKVCIHNIVTYVYGAIRETQSKKKGLYYYREVLKTYEYYAPMASMK